MRLPTLFPRLALVLLAAFVAASAHAQVSTNQTAGGSQLHVPHDQRPDPRSDNPDDACFDVRLRPGTDALYARCMFLRSDDAIALRPVRVRLLKQLTCKRPKGTGNKLAWSDAEYGGTIESLAVELSDDGSRYVVSGRCRPTGSHRHSTSRVFLGDKYSVDDGYLVPR